LSDFNPSLVQYLQRIVTLRTTYGYPFVVLGRMLRPPQPAVPSFKVPPVTGIPYTGANTQAFETSSILSSAWQSPQGEAALIFTDISDKPVSFSWKVSAADAQLDPSKPYNLYIRRNGVCTLARQGIRLPYTLGLDANTADVIMAQFSDQSSSTSNDVRSFADVCPAS
jgi:hypothetical protein